MSEKETKTETAPKRAKKTAKRRTKKVAKRGKKKAAKQPSEDRLVNRDKRGLFEKGTAPGPGNPHGKTVNRLRRFVITYMDDPDETDAQRRKRMHLVVESLYKEALAGDVGAIKELLDRTIGKVKNEVTVDATERATEVVRRLQDAQAARHNAMIWGQAKPVEARVVSSKDEGEK